MPFIDSTQATAELAVFLLDRKKEMMDKKEMAALEDAMSDLTFEDMEEAIDHMTECMAEFFYEQEKMKGRGNEGE